MTNSWASFSLAIAALAAATMILPTIVDLALRKEYRIHRDGAVLVSGTSTGIGNAACGALAEKYPKIVFFCGVLDESEAESYPFALANVKPVVLEITQDDQVKQVIVSFRNLIR